MLPLGDIVIGTLEMVWQFYMTNFKMESTCTVSLDMVLNKIQSAGKWKYMSLRCVEDYRREFKVKPYKNIVSEQKIWNAIEKSKRVL